MDRRACADLPALALQLLLAAHPEWKTLPAAVVDVDEPTGTLLWVNERAWRARLRPGMRHASALSLDARLRAGTVAAADLAAAVDGLATLLRSHTPHVEPSRDEAGVFWLDASGLESLYPSIDAWARSVARAIAARGFEARVVAGFTRFGTYALARAMQDGPALRRGARRVLVCESQDEERRLVRDVPLERLGLDAKLLASLSRLGIRSVGEFQALPADGIRRRFGEDAAHLHRRARGEAWDPLIPLAPTEALHRSIVLDDPVFDSGIVLFVVRRLVAELLGPLAAREQAARTVTVTMHRSLRRDKPAIVTKVRAAEPTLDEAVLLDLVRLGFESRLRRELAGSSVIEIEVEVEAAAAAVDQLRLFRERTRRDLAAGGRALARLRAELGEGSVVRAVLREGHLPEASFTWQPVDHVTAPSPRVVVLRPLVRRVHDHALALPPKPFRERDDCWIPSAATGEGRVDRMTGPYVVSGGWWNREVHREYHYARTSDGEILWVYYDRHRRRWFLAGKVE